MIENTLQNATLRPYLKRFFWIYSAYSLAALGITFIVAMFGINIQGNIGVAISWGISFATALAVSNNFFRQYQRFFTQAELSKMIMRATGLACLIQVILTLSYLGILFWSSHTAQASLIDEVLLTFFQVPYWLGLIIFVAIFLLMYVEQTISFRWFARRTINRRIKLLDSSAEGKL